MEDFSTRMPVSNDAPTSIAASASNRPKEEPTESKKKEKKRGKKADQSNTPEPSEQEADETTKQEWGTHTHGRTILFIRHGEKPAASEDVWGNLSATGRLRGTFLVEVLGVHGAMWTGKSPFPSDQPITPSSQPQSQPQSSQQTDSETKPLLDRHNTAPPATTTKKSKKAKQLQLNPSSVASGTSENPYIPPIAPLPSTLLTPAESAMLATLPPADEDKFPVSSQKNTTTIAPVRYIFASRPNDSGTQHLRMVQTVMPLMNHLNAYADTIISATDAEVRKRGEEVTRMFDIVPRLVIDKRFAVGEVHEVAQAIKELPDNLDPILVCWEHDALSDIAKCFVNQASYGKRKLKWKDDDFDSIWVVRHGLIEFRKQGFDQDRWEAELSRRRETDVHLMRRVESSGCTCCSVQ